MNHRRVPTHILTAAAVSLWALTGPLPDGQALAKQPPAPQQEQVAGSSGTLVTDARVSSGLRRTGDPDDLLQGGNQPPQPGTGTGSSTATDGRTIIQIILDILNSCWSALREPTTR